jgi:two-component system phosphate regulon sensor histidine kinase PhoR
MGEILATAEGNFTVSATLKHPEILFSPTERLTNWVALLLGSSVLAAGIGVWVIKRNIERERRLNELKSQFVSSVSHELRAPVGSIRLMADALNQGTVTGAEAEDFHRLMAQEGTRLSSLIENVLDFARIEQNRKTYTLAETDISTLIKDTIRLLTHQAAAQQITLQSDIQPLTHTPHLDAPAMQQALINLLDNAVKFSPAGETVQVILRENLPKNQWTLTVQDHGPGIPANEREKIFERFYRLGNELRRETQGTGIGLSLVKHIVEGNGGKISVTNNNGATFEMTFKWRGHSAP